MAGVLTYVSLAPASMLFPYIHPPPAEIIWGVCLLLFICPAYILPFFRKQHPDFTFKGNLSPCVSLGGVVIPSPSPRTLSSEWSHPELEAMLELLAPAIGPSTPL